MRLRSATFILAVLATPVMAEELIAHENGDVKWADGMTSTGHFSTCEFDTLAAGFKRDPALKKIPMLGDNAGSFACRQFWLRNDFERPIQCRVRIEQPTADRKSTTVVESDVVVPAADEIEAARLFGLADVPPTAFKTDCDAIPSQTSEFVAPTKACTDKLRAPSPQDFYPAEAARRGESGEIVLEYRVRPGSRELHDIRVVSSSGNAALDTAALRVAHAATTNNGCAGVPYRFKVKFEQR